MSQLEVSLFAALGLAVLAGLLSGWFLRSQFGGRAEPEPNRSRHGDSTAQLDACTRTGKPAPFIVDQAAEKRNPTVGESAPSVRNTFSIALDRHLPESARRGDPLSMLLVRLDQRRNSSERYVSRSDDKMIEAVGKLFIGSVRSTDWVARFDTSTFAFLLPGTPHANSMIVAERLRKAVSEADLPGDGASLQLTLSMGTTDFIIGDSSASILRRAEEALAAAVNAGGDCIRSQLGGLSRASSNGNCPVVC